MDREAYKGIIGIDEFLIHFPDKAWCHFHDVLEFRWYREYDYKEWRDKVCIELTMSDAERKDIICFRFNNVSGAKCDFSGWISGLEIVDLLQRDVCSEVHYEVLDYEDGQVHFYCDEIEVRVVRGDEKNGFI
ncbi:MAG: hypothetical protein IJB96_00065 [Lachnospira sp.]|nr:hypothetical protein [Lachnospira sp.]